MSGTSSLLILVGLFLAGGVISFVKQGLPRSLVVLLGLSAALALAAGIVRLEVWN